MKVMLKNISDGPRGVNTRSGLILVNPGETTKDPVSIRKAELQGLHSNFSVEVVEEDDPLDRDDDGAPGGSLSKDEEITRLRKSNAELRRQVEELGGKAEDDSPDSFDAMSDEELMDFVEKRDDKRPPANIKRETLLRRARNEDDGD